MIKIKQENTYKVLKPELFKAGEMLLGKYELYKNNAFEDKRYCFNKTFGTKEDIEYGSYNSFGIMFVVKTNTLHLHCHSFGGMCGFTFDEKELTKKHNKIDMECMQFTINFVKELIQEGIIEN